MQAQSSGRLFRVQFSCWWWRQRAGATAFRRGAEADLLQKSGFSRRRRIPPDSEHIDRCTNGILA
jgi:hypothetical protein